MKNLNTQIEELQSLYDDYTSNMQFNENLKEACLYLGDTIGSLRAVAEESSTSKALKALNEEYQKDLKEYIEAVKKIQILTSHLRNLASLLNITEDLQSDIETINQEDFNVYSDTLRTLKED